MDIHLTVIFSYSGSYRRWPITHNSRWVRPPWKTVELQHECHNQPGSNKQMGPQQRYFSSIFSQRTRIGAGGRMVFFPCLIVETQKPTGPLPSCHVQLHTWRHNNNLLWRLSLLALYFIGGSVGLVERALASTNVALVRFPHPVSYLDWVCWFFTLLWEVFPRVLWFSSLIKNQHLIWIDLICE